MIAPVLLTIVALSGTPQELVGAIQWGFESPLPHQHLATVQGLPASAVQGIARGEDAEGHPVQAPAEHIGPLPYLVIAAGNVADLWTTRAAFGRGAHEANPVIARLTFPQIVLAKAALTAGIAVAMYGLAQHGHPRLAKWIGYLDAGATGSVAISNTRVQR